MPEGADKYVEVTPEMVAEGVKELREVRLGDDLGYAVEVIYRAMEYERRAQTSAAASDSKDSK